MSEECRKLVLVVLGRESDFPSIVLPQVLISQCFDLEEREVKEEEEKALHTYMLSQNTKEISTLINVIKDGQNSGSCRHILSQTRLVSPTHIFSSSAERTDF